jgi:hypothetical protein
VVHETCSRRARTPLPPRRCRDPNALCVQRARPLSMCNHDHGRDASAPAQETQRQRPPQGDIRRCRAGRGGTAPGGVCRGRRRRRRRWAKTRCCPPALANASPPATIQPDGPCRKGCPACRSTSRSCNHGVQGMLAPPWSARKSETSQGAVTPIL